MRPRLTKPLNQEMAFHYASFLMLLLTASFVIGTVGFFIGIGISSFNFPIALLLSSAVFLHRAGRTIKFTAALWYLVYIHLFLIASYFVCIAFLDTTFDGLWYHQPAVAKLADGWNPVYDPFYATNIYDKTSYLSVQHFPKASWIIGSSIYKATGLIESAKMINFITIALVFFYAYAVFSKLFKERPAYNLAFSILVSLSPVATSQLLSNYVDGMLGGMLSIILLALIGMQQWESRSTKWHWFIFLSAIVIVTNLKFTGLFMAGVIIAVFSIYWWWKKQAIRQILRKYVLIAVVAASGLLIFGFNPYFTNWYHKGHVFYPLNIKEKDVVLLRNEPEILRGRNSVEKLFISLFSKSVNKIETKKISWKNPLSLTTDEIRVFSGTDVRLGGLGPLFLLGLLLSIPACLLVLGKMEKDRKLMLAIALAAIFLSVIFVPVAWWARYTPQLFLFPILISAFSLNAANKQNSKLSRFIAPVVLFVFCINLLLIAAPNIAGNIMKTGLIKKEMNELRSRKTPLLINFSKTEFQVLRTRLQEAGIKYTDCDTLQTNVRELRFIYKLYGYGPVYNIGE